MYIYLLNIYASLAALPGVVRVLKKSGQKIGLYLTYNNIFPSKFQTKYHERSVLCNRSKLKENENSYKGFKTWSNNCNFQAISLAICQWKIAVSC